MRSTRVRLWKLVAPSVICLTTVLFVSCQRDSHNGSQPRTGPTSTSDLNARKDVVNSNLQIVLEGPFAVCAAPSTQPGKIEILIPRAKDHFDPGFDADLDQTLLCGGDYSIH